jgi:hypothetical protein
MRQTRAQTQGHKSSQGLLLVVNEGGGTVEYDPREMEGNVDAGLLFLIAVPPQLARIDLQEID